MPDKMFLFKKKRFSAQYVNFVMHFAELKGLFRETGILLCAASWSCAVKVFFLAADSRKDRCSKNSLDSLKLSLDNRKVVFPDKSSKEGVAGQR